jgi:hypothetical protein
MKKEDIPILKSLDETVQNIITRGNVIPDLSESESIFCFSDYAGDRQSDQNNVYSFLFFVAVRCIYELLLLLLLCIPYNLLYRKRIEMCV